MRLNIYSMKLCTRKDLLLSERMHGWMDSFRTLLIRQDVTNASWTAWHFLAFSFWIIKHRILKL